MAGTDQFFTRRLVVDAECLYIGSNTVSTMNLIIASVTTAIGGKPVTGLTPENFKLVNFGIDDGKARPVSIGSFVELREELHNLPHGFPGVYKIEAIDENYLVGEVGQSVYALEVVRVLGLMAAEYGQAVIAAPVSRHPDAQLAFINEMVNP